MIFLILSTLLLASITSGQRQPVAQNIMNYGRWCGPDHGGYDDCCNGTYCRGCGSGPDRGDYDYQLNLDCFLECPPVDILDLACAQHDTCCHIFGSSCGHKEHCFCNHLLDNIACKYDPFNKVCLVFSTYDPFMSCWACGLNESDHPRCLSETRVYEFGPDFNTTLHMLLQFQNTGKVNMLKYAIPFGEGCSVDRLL